MFEDCGSSEFSLDYYIVLKKYQTYQCLASIIIIFIDFDLYQPTQNFIAVLYRMATIKFPN